jgi:hypothetical protein
MHVDVMTSTKDLLLTCKQMEYPAETPAYSQQLKSSHRLPPEEPNLPKIRVVVRKRPLNQKVYIRSLLFSPHLV